MKVLRMAVIDVGTQWFIHWLPRWYSGPWGDDLERGQSATANNLIWGRLWSMTTYHK